MQDIEKVVNTFQTKYEQGFLKKEIIALVRTFPGISVKRFNDALYGVTCKTVNGESVIYRHDIEKALRCGIENRDMTDHEMD